MSIAIIGPGGFIGEHLCRWLQERGHAITRHSSKNGTGINPVSGLMPESFALPDETSAVVYMSQSPYTNAQTDDYPHAFNVNALSAHRVATIAAQRRVRRFVFVSSANVYAPSFDPMSERHPCAPDGLYAATKLCGEMMARAACGERTSFTALRLFGVYGPGQRTRLMSMLRDRIEAGVAVTLQAGPGGARDGGLRMSWLRVDDACAAIERAALHESSDLPVAINVAGPRAYSLRETAEIIGQQMGIKPVFKETSMQRARDFIADLWLAGAYLGAPFRDLDGRATPARRHSGEIAA